MAYPEAATHALRTVVRLSDRLNPEYLLQTQVLPLSLAGGRVIVGTWRERVDEHTTDDLRLLFAGEPDYLTIPEALGRSAIDKLYGKGQATAEGLVAELGSLDQPIPERGVPLEDLRHRANEAPVVQLVNLLLLEAVEARASDIHLERTAPGLRVRYRIDGVLQPAPSPPHSLIDAVISRIKLMAELDIAERRAPQDGRIKLRLRERNVDVRVATLPTLHGESCVIRLLDDETARARTFEELGFDTVTCRRLREALALPHGIMLATGPTGSGKTTSLYAGVAELADVSRKVIAVEDPVEYELANVSQVPVSARTGLSFALALRSILRHDPDVLLIGEIRDAETAAVASHAALTGHLVLSSVHTTDAASAAIRLLELGVPDYIVASTTAAVLAQRLVRRICEYCREPVESLAWASASLGVELAGAFEGRGCIECRGTGYRGRTAIGELLSMDAEIRDCVPARSADRIRELMRKRGWRNLREDGALKIEAGLTTAAEVLRTTREA